MRGAISVGAHYGEEYEGWLSMGAINFIFFEPVMANFVKLKQIVGGKPGVTLHNMALGSFRGHVQMFTERDHNGKSCSVLRPKLHLTQYPDITFPSRELVPVEKLDNIKYDRSLFDHLHIDTQGYELEVLRGARNSLEHIQTITAEVYREELYEGCAMIDEVTDWLFDRGFEIKHIYWRGLTWGDATYEKG